MELTNDNDVILKDYYKSQKNPVKPCNKNTKSHWWRFTPYDWEETIYWFIKHLTLPVVAVIIIAIILVIQFFENPILDSIGYILASVAFFCALSVTREFLRARKYKIPIGEIKVDIDENNQEKEGLDKRPLNNITEPIFKIGFV